MRVVFLVLHVFLRIRIFLCHVPLAPTVVFRVVAVQSHKRRRRKSVMKRYPSHLFYRMMRR
jgi:hypothetical protein